MDVYETLACLEMIQDYINCKAARMKALGSLGFSDNMMGRGNKILKISVLLFSMIYIFLENSQIEGLTKVKFIEIIVFRGAVVYVLLNAFYYIPLSGLLFLFCSRRQIDYRKSEDFLLIKNNFKVELEQIAQNVTFLLQQLENSQVPDFYQSHNALLYFREVIEDKKARNLKEAIVLYEDYLNENNLYGQFLEEKQIFRMKIADLYNDIDDINISGYQSKMITKFVKKLY